MARSFVEVARAWGLTVNITKTKALAVENGCSQQGVVVDTGTIELMTSFPYLGSIVQHDGQIGEEVTARIAKASRVFGRLRRPVFDNNVLSLSTKRRVYAAMVLTTLLYGA